MFAVPDWPAANPNPKTAETSYPKDWGVYEDIVKKVFAHYQKRAAYFEVWNEANLLEFSFDLTGTPYKDAVPAYKDLYLHAIRAIRQVDKSFPVGGPATSGIRSDWLMHLLKDERIKPELAFASWHEYTDKPLSDSGFAEMRKTAVKYGAPTLPLLITEWNASDKPLAATSPDAVSFAGARLTSYLNAGMDGAYMYGGDGKFSAEYAFVNPDGTLTPKASVYRLLSHKLGLGGGTSRIMSADSKGVTIAGAAINADGHHVVRVVNDDRVDRPVTVRLKHLSAARIAAVSHFIASATQAALDPMQINHDVQPADGEWAITLNVAGKSVYGVLLVESPHKL